MTNWYLNARMDWTEDSTRMIITPSLIAKKMFFYVQEVGYLHALENYFTERVDLDSYLIVYTVKGKGVLHYRKDEIYVKPGDAFFINCREYQHYKSANNSNWSLYFLHFYGQNSDDFFGQFMKNGGPVIRTGGDSTITDRIEKIMHLHMNMDRQSELWTSKYITDILTTILSYSLKSGTGTDLFFMPDYIREVTKFIDENYFEKIKLDLLSEKFAISKFHLTREFKKHTGVTPYEYQLQKRMNQAKHLLKYSNQTINEIADRIGIDQVSYFIHIFKQHENMTPLQFRKVWRK